MLTYIKALLAIKSFISWLQDVYGLVMEKITQAKQRKALEEAEKAAQEYKDANQIEDENERKKQKAEAACKLEKSLDPNADC